ncbi:MAG: hypothetical protein AAF696_06290 [Bacteroidota bacterium]
MRNSSLSHLLNPNALYSTLLFSLLNHLPGIVACELIETQSSSSFVPLSSSTLGSFSSFSQTRKKLKLRKKAPLLLAFLAIFCFGMGLGIQQIFPNSDVHTEGVYAKSSGKSRLGACIITDKQVKLDLTLLSSPRIQIYIKHFGGEVVYRRDVNMGRQKKLNMDIDLSVFPEGLYMLKVESGDQQMVRLINHS